jgi:hypothetical protein
MSEELLHDIFDYISLVEMQNATVGFGQNGKVVNR